MNNIHLSILGSNPFTNILNELEFNKIINPNIELNSNKKILVKILFPENLKIKTVKDYLIEKGVKDDISFPKDVLKEAFTNGLITNEDEWLSMLKARNITSHIYDSETASKIAKKIANDYMTAFMELYNYFS